MSDSKDEPVIVSWTPIWVTIVVGFAQGLLFYSFFQHRRKIDKIQYESEKDKLLSTVEETDLFSEQQPSACNLYEPRQNTRSHRSPRPFASGAWWNEVLKVSDDETLRCVGLDTYMFLRLLYVGMRITGFGSILSLILLPVYATGNASGPETEQFNLLTLARVEQGSTWRLYVSVLVWYIFCLFILYQFWMEWTLYYKHHTVFSAQGDMDMSIDYRYSVRVEQVLSNSDGALRAYFERLFPGKVKQTASVIQTCPLEKLIAERQKYILKLEVLVAARNAKPEKPPKQIKVKRVKVDAAGYYESEIARLNADVDSLRRKLIKSSGLNRTSKKASVAPAAILPSSMKDEAKGQSMEEGVETGLDMVLPTTSSTSQKKDLPLIDDPSYPEDEVLESDIKKIQSSTAFVTFTSLRAKQAALQCELTGNPDSMIVFPAADPEFGTIWSNVSVPLRRQIVFQFQAACFFTAGILFWAIPVLFVTSISNLNSILKAFGLPLANANAFWYGLVAGLLPVIMLAVLMIVLYMVITKAATSFIRYKSWPEVDSYCLFWHMLFQFANLWLILIGGSVFNQIDAIIKNFSVESVVEIIAKAMPGASLFFVNMIVCSSFGAFSMELSMFVKYVVTMIMNIISPEAARTQRQLDDGRKPQSLVWGQKVPPIIFIFLVSIIYSKCLRAKYGNTMLFCLKLISSFYRSAYRSNNIHICLCLLFWNLCCDETPMFARLFTRV
jgi:calcium permeable stress-gated cation channel